MPRHDLSHWQHDHDFNHADQTHAERRTLLVTTLTALTMVIELVCGWLTGSMALLADGWHMASHAGALGLAAWTYAYARRHARDRRFTFGTGKVTALGGYTSAVLLGLVAIWMAWESLLRLWQPVPVRYAEAMGVAVLGLLVNLASAWLLGGHGHGHAHDADDPDHSPDDHHAHDHDHGHDHNLRAAYLHVLADALTSVLAILALAGGAWLGWAWLDPAMGLVGAVLIARWAVGLTRDCAHVLLDAEDHGALAAQIRARIEAEPDHQIADLHIWRIGAGSRACILALVTHTPLPLDHYRERLADLAGLDHLTIEINHCQQQGCTA